MKIRIIDHHFQNRFFRLMRFKVGNNNVYIWSLSWLLISIVQETGCPTDNLNENANALIMITTRLARRYEPFAPAAQSLDKHMGHWTDLVLFESPHDGPVCAVYSKIHKHRRNSSINAHMDAFAYDTHIVNSSRISRYHATNSHNSRSKYYWPIVNTRHCSLNKFVFTV